MGVEREWRGEEREMERERGKALTDTEALQNASFYRRFNDLYDVRVLET
jgi:hypothetical protein